MFGGLTHRPAVELARLLNHVTPPDLDKVFFTDSGSVAVEVALKMALQYHRGSNKTKICSLRGGYHGDTLGAMSVCDPDTGMHSTLFPPDQETMLPRQVFVLRPPCDSRHRVGSNPAQKCHGCTCENNNEESALEASLKNLEMTLEAQHETLAALILEPLVQGAGGMRFYSPRYLQRARELCDEYNLLLICDEIATGFGRSGGNSLFACQEASITPDILCIGKALTGGYMTLGAVLATSRVAEGVSSSTSDGVALPLMHGPTFMGNPLACAVAVASVNMLIRKENSSLDNSAQPFWKSRVNAVEKYLKQGLAEAHTIPGVADVRVKGAIGVIEMKDPLDASKVAQRCAELGVWLRPFGRLLYTMPPYVMTEHEVLRVTQVMMQLAKEHSPHE
jgi:adenosylmethionine-8-amino-7-oxononanoate aminotransferase